jgi:sulfur carrier protein
MLPREIPSQSIHPLSYEPINNNCMNILMNGESTQITQEITLLELLTQHHFADKIGIAVAVNQTVIPKTNWDAKTIKENDSILIISATKGG